MDLLNHCWIILRVDPQLRLASQSSPDQEPRQVENDKHDQDTGEPARHGHARVVLVLDDVILVDGLDPVQTF